MNFIKFNRADNNVMRCMFLGKINIFSFNTDNIAKINNMHRCCKSLKKLNLSNFNTHKVTI